MIDYFQKQYVGLYKRVIHLKKKAYSLKQNAALLLSKCLDKKNPDSILVK